METPSRGDLVSYIRRSAMARGIDPNVAIAVAESEGLNADPAEAWQSTIVSNGVREPSYGPYQLYMGGGLGNRFVSDTGLDPRDPSTAYEQIDYALDAAKEQGWTPWYGAEAAGISPREGINGSRMISALQDGALSEMRPFTRKSSDSAPWGTDPAFRRIYAGIPDDQRQALVRALMQT